MPKKEIGFLRSGFIRSNSKLFMGVGSLLLRIFPKSAVNLKQSGIELEYNVKPREFLSMCFFLFVCCFIVVSGLVSGFFLTFGGKNPIIKGEIALGGNAFPMDMLIGPLLGGFVGFFLFFQNMSYPKVIVNRRVKDIDKNLLFVLRTILVQVRSGVPIFNTFVSIATGDYGEISQEFRSVIEKVRAGKPVIGTLEELTVRNPSLYFRRAMWQIVNALKSGSDIADNLENVIKALSKEQLVEIKKYQSTLNPLAMMYMMVAVIAPSLGITVMIVLSTFPGMGAIGDPNTFWALLIGVSFMQFMFMSVIKSKRPNLMG